MEIILIRYCYSRWGVMGALYVGGLCICHTCEHPDRHLSVGKYDVNLMGEKLFINVWLNAGKRQNVQQLGLVMVHFTLPMAALLLGSIEPLA